MKKALLTLVQFILFLLTFAAGSFLAPMKIRQVLSVQPDGTHVFLWDGVLWVALVLVIILAFEAATQRIRTAAWTLVALVFALIAGLAFRLGFMTV